MKTFSQLKTELNESHALRNEVIPSPMLVLKRSGIRIFPDGRKVALYLNDKYGLVFTIPFGSSATPDEPVVGVTNAG